MTILSKLQVVHTIINSVGSNFVMTHDVHSVEDARLVMRVLGNHDFVMNVDNSDLKLMIQHPGADWVEWRDDDGKTIFDLSLSSVAPPFLDKIPAPYVNIEDLDTRAERRAAISKLITNVEGIGVHSILNFTDGPLKVKPRLGRVSVTLSFESPWVLHPDRQNDLSSFPTGGSWEPYVLLINMENTKD